MCVGLLTKGVSIVMPPPLKYIQGLELGGWTHTICLSLLSWLWPTLVYFSPSSFDYHLLTLAEEEKSHFCITISTKHSQHQHQALPTSVPSIPNISNKHSQCHHQKLPTSAPSTNNLARQQASRVLAVPLYMLARTWDQGTALGATSTTIKASGLRSHLIMVSLEALSRPTHKGLYVSVSTRV